MAWIAPRTWVAGETVTAALMNTHLRDNLNALRDFGKVLRFTDSPATELTIASGVITVTQAFHIVDTEADAASDDLTTINGGADGYLLQLRQATGTRDVVVKHAADNIQLRGAVDFTLLNVNYGLLLANRDGTTWLEIGRSQPV